MKRLLPFLICFIVTAAVVWGAATPPHDYSDFVFRKPATSNNVLVANNRIIKIRIAGGNQGVASINPVVWTDTTSSTGAYVFPCTLATNLYDIYVNDTLYTTVYHWKAGEDSVWFPDHPIGLSADTAQIALLADSVTALPDTILCSKIVAQDSTFVIDPVNKRVGIFKLAPAKKLDVDGEIQTNSFLRFANGGEARIWNWYQADSASPDSGLSMCAPYGVTIWNRAADSIRFLFPNTGRGWAEEEWRAGGPSYYNPAVKLSGGDDDAHLKAVGDTSVDDNANMWINYDAGGSGKLYFAGGDTLADFEVDTAGNVTIDGSFRTDREAEGGFLNYTYGTSAYPSLKTYRGRGTEASPESVQTGDVLAAWRVYGRDADGWFEVADIRALTEGTTKEDTIEGRWNFRVKDANATWVNAMTIRSDGDVGVGVTSPAQKLDVTGGNVKADSFIGAMNVDFADSAGKVDTIPANNPSLLAFVQDHAATGTFDSFLVRQCDSFATSDSYWVTDAGIVWIDTASGVFDSFQVILGTSWPADSSWITSEGELAIDTSGVGAAGEWFDDAGGFLYPKETDSVRIITGTPANTLWATGTGVSNVHDDAIVKADFADEDWGDLSVSSNSVTLDADVVAAPELANSTVTLAHMDDVDHGQVSWVTGQAIVEACDPDVMLAEDQGDITTNADSTWTLDNDVVANAEMADNAIGNAEMADNAIGNAEMLDNAIGNAEMADNAVGNAEMLDNAIGQTEMADDAIGPNEMANADHGNVVWAAGVATVDSCDPDALLPEDQGDITITFGGTDTAAWTVDTVGSPAWQTWVNDHDNVTPASSFGLIELDSARANTGDTIWAYDTWVFEAGISEIDSAQIGTWLDMFADAIQDSMIDFGINATAGKVSPKDFADEDVGEMSVSSNEWLIDDNVIGYEHFKHSEDWGDVTTDALDGAIELDVDVVDSTNITNGTIINEDIKASTIDTTKIVDADWIAYIQDHDVDVSGYMQDSDTALFADTAFHIHPDSLFLPGWGNVTFVPIDSSIQAAVTAADSGATLLLDCGTYTITSTITLAKPINIVGQGNAGFATTPITPAHGTLILSTTNNITAFQIDADNVRIADLSIDLEGDNSKAVNTANNLVGLVFNTVDVIVDCAGTAEGFSVLGSNVVMRNLTFYVTSSDNTASGVFFSNNASTTQDATCDCFNVTGTALGGLTYAYGFACYNVNDANTLTLNLNNSRVVALAGTALDVAVASASVTTTNSTVNAYLCTFDGADYDAYCSPAGNTLNLGASVMENKLIFGTVTYRATMAAGEGIFGGGLTMTSGSITDTSGTIDFGDENLTTSGTIDGRDVSVDGTKLDGVEALADVTDATNVDAAGAVMETDAAGGDLTGTYPNPTLTTDCVAAAEMDDADHGDVSWTSGVASVDTNTAADTADWQHWVHNNDGGGGIDTVGGASPITATAFFAEGANVTITRSTNTITIASTGGGALNDGAYGATWNGVTDTAGSKNAIYDYLHQLDTDDDSAINSIDAGAVTATEIAADAVEASELALNSVDTSNMIDGDYGDFSLAAAAFTLDNDVVKDEDIDWADVSATDMSDFGTMTATSGNILVADGSDFESVTMSGDATIATGGALSLANNSVGDAELAASIVIDTMWMVAGWGSGTYDTVKIYNDVYWSSWTPPTSITLDAVWATVQGDPDVDSLHLQILKGGVPIHHDTIEFRIKTDSTTSNTPFCTLTAGTWKDEYTCKVLHTDSTASGLSVFIRYKQAVVTQ